MSIREGEALPRSHFPRVRRAQERGARPRGAPRAPRAAPRRDRPPRLPPRGERPAPPARLEPLRPDLPQRLEPLHPARGAVLGPPPLEATAPAIAARRRRAPDRARARISRTVAFSGHVPADRALRAAPAPARRAPRAPRAARAAPRGAARARRQPRGRRRGARRLPAPLSLSIVLRFPLTARQPLS